MQPWFRLYREALHDPKLLALSDSDHRMWFNLLCLADPASGKLPTIEAIGFTLRRDPDGVRTVVERLANGGLIDRASGGTDGWHYAVHGWSTRQFKSDTSTERVKRFRAVTRNVSETPSDTDTDTEADTEKRGSAREAPHRPERPREIPSDTSDLYTAVLAAMMLDHNCSQKSWQGVMRVVARFSNDGRTPDFVRRQAEWFSTVHWPGKVPGADHLIDTAVQFASLGGNGTAKPKVYAPLTPEQIEQRDSGVRERQRLAAEQMERKRLKANQ